MLKELGFTVDLVDTPIHPIIVATGEILPGRV